MDYSKQAEELNNLRYMHLRELARLGAVSSRSGENGILMCLLVHDRALLSGELVEKTGLSTGRVANILKQLELKQWIQRLQDRDDKRRVHVSLTPEGREQALALQRDAVRRNEGLLSYLGEADAAELGRLTERCLRYARDILPEK